MSLDRVNLRGADFSGRKLKIGVQVFESELRECLFEDMKIGQASWGSGQKQSCYFECSFNRTRMGMKSPGFAKFERCSFEDVVIRDMHTGALDLIGCRVSGTLTDAIITARPESFQVDMYGRERNVIEGNDLSEANLVGVSFRGGVDLTRNRMPSGPNYLTVLDGRRVLGSVKESLLRLPPSAERDEALVLVGVDLGNLVDGQEHVFLRRDAIGRFARGQQLEFDTALRFAGRTC